MIPQEVQNMSEKLEAIQAANVTFQQEANSRMEEIKVHVNTMYADIKMDMTAILHKLGEKPKEESDDEKLDHKETDKTPIDNHASRRLFQFTDSKDDDILRRSLLRFSPVKDAKILPTQTLGQMKHSIIVPPATVAQRFTEKTPKAQQNS